MKRVTAVLSAGLLFIGISLAMAQNKPAADETKGQAQRRDIENQNIIKDYHMITTTDTYEASGYKLKVVTRLSKETQELDEDSILPAYVLEKRIDKSINTKINYVDKDFNVKVSRGSHIPVLYSQNIIFTPKRTNKIRNKLDYPKPGEIDHSINSKYRMNVIIFTVKQLEIGKPWGCFNKEIPKYTLKEYPQSKTILELFKKNSDNTEFNIYIDSEIAAMPNVENNFAFGENINFKILPNFKKNGDIFIKSEVTIRQQGSSRTHGYISGIEKNKWNIIGMYGNYFDRESTILPNDFLSKISHQYLVELYKKPEIICIVSIEPEK